ncbi:hypothetical protein MZM54_05350 [[Brevibacterium] frigoritolerans]|nr:hypothetical protein [Peribacillus frigoritolerans]
MKVKLKRNLYGLNNRIVMSKDEEFKVEEALNRFNCKCYEIAEGDKQGYLLAISDCDIQD